MCKPGEKCENPCPNCTCKQTIMVVGNHGHTGFDPALLHSMRARTHLVVLEHPKRVLIGSIGVDEELAKRALDALVPDMASIPVPFDGKDAGKPDPRRMGRRELADMRRRVRNGK